MFAAARVPSQNVHIQHVHITQICQLHGATSFPGSQLSSFSRKLALGTRLQNEVRMLFSMNHHKANLSE